MCRKSMLRLIISTSMLLIFLPSQSIASDWRDTLKALKNEVIKNVPSVSGVMGTNLKCERKDSFFAENHTLVLNTKLNTLLWETYQNEPLNMPMNIIKETNKTIEAEVKHIIFFTAASKIDPKINALFQQMNKGLETTYSDLEQRDIAKSLMHNSKMRIILDRTTGLAEFIEDAIEWPKNMKRPKVFRGRQKQTENFICEKLEKKF